MSSPKFIVFKLKDLRIPALVVLIVIVLFVFMVFNNKISPTFAPITGYEDGRYTAGITVSNTDLDLVVEVKDNNITSISLAGLTEETPHYDDLNSGLEYINTYVTATQSLELPQNGSTTSATMLLMDAVKVALSDDTKAYNTSYEKIDVSNQGTEVTNSSDALNPDEVTDSPEALNSSEVTDSSEPASSNSVVNSLNEDDIWVDEFDESEFPILN